MIMRSPERIALRKIVVTMLTIVLWTPAHAQPCNPVIDGTYCATQTDRRQNNSIATSAPMRFDGLGSSLSPPPGANEPGMLGTITFNNDGKSCLGGLLRGVRCN
jgi:hypothetical protein